MFGRVEREVDWFNNQLNIDVNFDDDARLSSLLLVSLLQLILTQRVEANLGNWARPEGFVPKMGTHGDPSEQWGVVDDIISSIRSSSHGQFLARNDPNTLIASWRPLHNVTHALACKNFAWTGPKLAIGASGSSIHSFSSTSSIRRRSPSIHRESSLRFHSEALEDLVERYALEKVLWIDEKRVRSALEWLIYRSGARVSYDSFWSALALSF